MTRSQVSRSSTTLSSPAARQLRPSRARAGEPENAETAGGRVQRLVSPQLGRYNGQHIGYKFADLEILMMFWMAHTLKLLLAQLNI